MDRRDGGCRAGIWYRSGIYSVPELWCPMVLESTAICRDLRSVIQESGVSDLRKTFWRILVAVLTFTSLPSPAAAGDCRAMVRPLLLRQVSGETQLAEAREVCEVEAALGDPDAEYQLALFALGLAEWSPTAAIPRIESAAIAGVPEAQYWLAWQREAGPLLPNDSALAKQWYQRAADADHRLALQRLADAHEKGELGLRRDAALAELYRARAERCAN